MRLSVVLSGWALAITALCLAPVAAGRTRHQPRYWIVALPTVRGCTTVPDRINNRGEVVGEVIRNGRPTYSPAVHVFLYRQGRLKFLPGPFTEPKAINDSGEVVGTGRVGKVKGDGAPFVYLNGRLRQLPPDLSPESVNDAGQIVGTYRNTTPTGRACILTQGKMAFLPPLRAGGYSSAKDINSAGQVVGFSYRIKDGPPTHAVYWLNRRIHDLGCGSDEDGGSEAVRNNHRGDILGNWQNHDGPTHGYLISAGRKIWLEPLQDHDSTPLGLNDEGDVVGSSGVDTTRACLWTAGRVQDLNRLISRGTGWVLESANDINNAGVICGEGRLHGRAAGFLLFPRTGPGANKG